MRFCSECGQPNPEKGAFCKRCGHSLTTAVGQVQPRWQRWLTIAGGLIVGSGLAVAAAFFWLPLITFQPVTRVPAIPTIVQTEDERFVASSPDSAQNTPFAEPTPMPTNTTLPMESPSPTATTTPLPLITPLPTATATLEPTASPISIEFLVPSTQAQLNTGLPINQGQRISIEYLSGSWRAGPLPTWPLVGPAGDPQVTSKASFPVPNAPVMTLIAGIGSTPPFPVYDRLTFVATTSGMLWLGANDDNFSDNGGSLTIRVTIDVAESGSLMPPANAMLTADVEAQWLTGLPTEDVWDSLPVYHSGHRVYAHPSWDGSEDLQAYWRLGWDDDYLYVFVVVLDDIHVQTQTGNQIYRGDSLEMQIDTNRAAGLNYPTPAIFQIALSPGNFADIPPSAFRFQGNNQRQIRDAPSHSIIVNASQAGNGYILDAAIPWRDLNVTPYAGLVLGAALNANDNDTPGTAVQEVMMSNVPGRVLSNPFTWGTLTLRP